MQSRRNRDAAKAFLAAATAATLLASTRAAAQTQSQLVVTGGVATDQRGVRSNALTVAPSVQLAPSNGASLSLGGSATRFGNDAWSLGAGTAFSGRAPVAGPIALSLDASANGSRLQEPSNVTASFASAELLPALELTAGALTLFGGMRAATGFASQDVARQTLPGFNGGTMSQSRTQSAAGPTFGATFLVTSSPDGKLRLGAREDRLRVSGVAVADRALTASIASNVVSLAASAGQRRASDERAAFGSAGLSIALRNDVALDAAAGRYASNRLTGTPAGDFFNVGFSFRFGGTPARSSALPAARVRGAPGVPSGYTRLVIEAPDAARVDVAGDFNEWTPVAASRAAGGVWYADLRITPGQYRYAFRVDGKEWRVPRGATAVDDGFGGKSAWLIVREPGR